MDFGINFVLLQVLVIAIFNLLVVYYVATSVSLEDNKKFVPKFQTRLPKDSKPQETNTRVQNPSENDKQDLPNISTNTGTDDDDFNDDDDDEHENMVRLRNRDFGKCLK